MLYSLKITECDLEFNLSMRNECLDFCTRLKEKNYRNDLTYFQ